MGNKYEEALEDIESGFQEEEISYNRYLELELSLNLLKELVDRDKNGFSHVLSYKKDGRAYLIAFHSSQDADDFAEKNDVKNGHLNSVQFWEGYKK